MSTRDVIGTPQRRRPTRAGTVLSAELIVERAIALSGEHGPEALSVRRLGRALGCDPSALYRYFRDADDLMLAMADRLLADALDGLVPQDDGIATLREFAERIYTTMQAHPQIAALTGSRVTRRENEFRAVEIGLSAVQRIGYRGLAAVRAYHAFVDAVLGLAALDATALALPRERWEADGAAWADAYQRLPAADYPTIAGLRRHLHQMKDSCFPDTLDLLLSALAAQVQR